MMVYRCQQLSLFFLLVVLTSNMISLVTANKRSPARYNELGGRDRSDDRSRMSNPHDDRDRRGNARDDRGNRDDRGDRGDRDRDHGSRDDRRDRMDHSIPDDRNTHDVGYNSNVNNNEHGIGHTADDGHDHDYTHKSDHEDNTRTNKDHKENGGASIGFQLSWFQRIVLAGTSLLMVVM
ncbi:U1 small nuclear ribonucleoprotein 70 kDa [Octopus bimaculoides]|uniref:Uncharacterized protein n=1 Tax=Octopus bimaculoides TaxID=37653 RepID=A0A0L8FVD1_OCTBM|nr:U1 small nuclear ribonucleoprotein 70 kDa [Octopus bimaculoides]|eukprot:XP_014786561.1 PREDICTED: U1 small nuclear ribonucleoprotein 70 kDa-like [Octopus bimaculoides]